MVECSRGIQSQVELWYNLVESCIESRGAMVECSTDMGEYGRVK